MQYLTLTTNDTEVVTPTAQGTRMTYSSAYKQILPLLAFKPSTQVIISYSEALSLLEIHAGHEKKALDKEISEILKLMIFSYFSQYSSVLTDTHDNKLYRLLESNNFNDFDNSDIAMQVTLSIIKTTQTFLPGFNSHNQADCVGILDMKMRDRNSIQIEIDPDAFMRFVGN